MKERVGIMRTRFRDTVIEIDLNKLSRNIKLIRDMVGDSVAIVAVVKANGYGHGAVEISKTLIDSGVEYLSVATLSEAIKIRERHNDFPILIMGHTPSKYMEHVAKNNITATIFSYDQARILDKLARENDRIARVHIKIDTGFHRLGLDAKDIEMVVDEVQKIHSVRNIYCEGIFSHLALVNRDENAKQFELFKRTIYELSKKGIEFKYKHIADSIAAVDYPEYRMNMVRVGALIYGMRGFHTGYLDVEQIMTFKTAVSQLHSIKKGEGVGYDFLWKADRDSVIATLPFGYADGYPRNMRERGYVTIKGKKCPMIGVLCMDQVMVDVTEIKDLKEGDEAVIYGSKENEMTVQEASQLAGTNKNDILSRLTDRPYREYIY